MLNLDEVIENNDGPEFDTFEGELEKLSKEQLEQLIVEEDVYKAEQVETTDRDFLEIDAAEVSWREFFSAYHKVVGRPFVLDK
jgi:hypothetical protein